MSEAVWLAEYEENGAVVFRIGRAGDDLVAEWIGTVTLRARRDGSDVRFEPEAGAEPLDLAKIRQGSARLLLRQLEGKLALHGAAVELEGRAVLLLGRSGQGKSTLAAALCARGARLLSDDAIALEAPAASGGAYEVVPFETDHWLDARSRRALGGSDDDAWKLPVRAPRVADAKVPLVAMIELSFGESAAPEVHALGGVEAMAALVPQVARFVLDDAEVQRRELEVLGDLVARVPRAARLVRPRDLAALDAAVGAVVDLVGR